MKQSFDSSNYIIKKPSNSRETKHKEVQQKKKVTMKGSEKRPKKMKNVRKETKFSKLKNVSFEW